MALFYISISMNKILYTIIVTHITIICVTLYLHRNQAHKSVSFHPIVEHFMRFWLWLTTGMVTKEWVAVHRKHHQATDTPLDPHSPKIYGIRYVLFGGVFLYIKAKKNPEIIKLGVGSPDDWIERKVYTPYPTAGIILMLLIDIFLFGISGFIIWMIQILWIPINAAGIVNGLCHWWGYRNTDTSDTSRNLIPIDFWCGGEFLHNNHHSNGACPKFSQKWYEFDIGWFYIRILEIFGLAYNIRR